MLKRHDRKADVRNFLNECDLRRALIVLDLPLLHERNADDERTTEEFFNVDSLDTGLLPQELDLIFVLLRPRIVLFRLVDGHSARERLVGAILGLPDLPASLSKALRYPTTSGHALILGQLTRAGVDPRDAAHPQRFDVVDDRAPALDPL